MTEDRRHFERVGVPFEARVTALNQGGKELGTVRQLSRGGMMLEPSDDTLHAGKRYSCFLMDQGEELRIPLSFTVRHANARRIGCEFESMDEDAAVAIGVLLGKYYSGNDAA